MPLMSFFFPIEFRQRHPKQLKQFRRNKVKGKEQLKIDCFQHRLTSNFDIYRTLLNIATNRLNESGSLETNNKGLSLFTEIPRARTCQHADIPVNFCTCQETVTDNFSSNRSLNELYSASEVDEQQILGGH